MCNLVKQLLQSLCLFVCLNTWNNLRTKKKFFWWNLLLENFAKMCQAISIFIQTAQFQQLFSGAYAFIYLYSLVISKEKSISWYPLSCYMLGVTDTTVLDSKVTDPRLCHRHLHKGQILANMTELLHSACIACLMYQWIINFFIFM
jgi:hypothetical protein